MYKRGEKNKNGLSTIVITLIIILVSLVAVGIVWVVVNNVLQEGTENANLQQFTLDARILDASTDNISNNVTLTVKRNLGEEELTGMKFVFSDGKNSEIITEQFSIDELEEKRFVFHLVQLNVSYLESISIVPIIKQDEKEVVGNILQEYNTGGGGGTPTTCSPATCSSLGYECGNWPDGCEGTLSCGVFGNGSCETGYICNASRRCEAQSICSVTLQSTGNMEYNAQFSHGLPTSNTFFPIGVWYEYAGEQPLINLDKEAGINTYVVLTGDSSLPLISSNGMNAILQTDPWLSRRNDPGSEAIKGWFIGDEVDMIYGPTAGYQYLSNILATLPSDGRLRMSNYGKGVMFETWETNAQAAQFVNNYQDYVSADLYWFTDNDLHSFSQSGIFFYGDDINWSYNPPDSEVHLAANYGKVVDRLRYLLYTPGSKQLWCFVEDGHPFSNDASPTITQPEMTAAIWSCIIHGASGVIYFNHNFGGTPLSQHVYRDIPAVRAEMHITNGRITELAPVINAPYVTDLVNSSSAVDYMVKWYNGHFYIFAGSNQQTSQTATFNLPKIGTGTATVLYENRTIGFTNSFNDTFANGNAVHIYRIDGGDTCGL